MESSSTTIDNTPSVEDLKHKLEAANQREGPRGEKVRQRNRRITVNLASGVEPVYVGVDCAGEGRAYVDLHPSLFAAVVKVGERRELVPELAALSWEGKRVILTPPSTVATNKREVWGEFFLANLLRGGGASVQSLRLPPLNGRRRTFSQANGAGVLVEPPFEARKAAEKADEASTLAKEVDGERRALPRKRVGRKLAEAVEFVRQYGVSSLTKEVVREAKAKGISRSTLRRALQACGSKYPQEPSALV